MFPNAIGRYVPPNIHQDHITVVVATGVDNAPIQVHVGRVVGLDHVRWDDTPDRFQDPVPIIAATSLKDGAIPDHVTSP